MKNDIKELEKAIDNSIKNINNSVVSKCRKMAETNLAVKKRFNHLLYRSVEELYDIEKDPHCLNNLIDSLQHQAIKQKLQNKLEQWMISTKPLGSHSRLVYSI